VVGGSTRGPALDPPTIERATTGSGGAALVESALVAVAPPGPPALAGAAPIVASGIPMGFGREDGNAA
jgi:hypothetical protein